MHRLRLRWPLWASMAAIAIAAILFVALRPQWPGWVERYEQWQKNRPVHGQLDRSIPLRHPNGITLAALVAAVESATRCPEFPKGLPIFVDRQGMAAVGTTLAASMTIDVNGVPLRRSLSDALRQLKLGYVVRDGIIMIVDPDDAPEGF